jgi:indole-3-acetate monooxygenase
MDLHVERLWKRIWALKPLIDAHRDEGQALHHLPDPVARAFVEANVYRLLLPVEYGGENLDPVTYGDLIEEVASYDGSAGWNFSIGSSTPFIFGDLSPSRLQAIFGTPDACVAASTTPLGRAVEVDGGYRLTGRFAWASGVHHARWVVAMGAVFDGPTMRKSPGGTPIILGFVMPKEDCTVLDTRHVLGMRGTGSTEFEADNVLVPKDLAIPGVSLSISDLPHASDLFRLQSRECDERHRPFRARRA